jgi:hypothetical protein
LEIKPKIPGTRKGGKEGGREEGENDSSQPFETTERK